MEMEGSGLDADSIKASVEDLLRGADLSTITVNSIAAVVESQLGLPANSSKLVIKPVVKAWLEVTSLDTCGSRQGA